jgi:hypothetical protein
MPHPGFSYQNWPSVRKLMHMLLARNGVDEMQSMRDLDEYKRLFDASEE